MGVVARLIVEYGFRVAVIILVIGLAYVAFRYVFRSGIEGSSDSEQKNKKGPIEPEVCSQCSGPLDADLKCEYCGTRHR